MIRTALVALTVFPLFFVAANADEPAPSRQSISVLQFGRSNVIGYLGKPLGTVVRVTGTVVDGNTTRARIDAHKILLEVHAVNGTDLDRPIQFDHPYVRDRTDLPEPGTQFDYFVHEHGSFSGFVDIPANIESDQPVVANDGFYYRRSITIHSKHAHDRPLEPPSPTKRFLDGAAKTGMPMTTSKASDG